MSPILLCILASAVSLSRTNALAPANPAAVVFAGNARFTILSERMIRAERTAVPGSFDDNATLLVVNRALPVPIFSVSHNGSITTISTSALTLVYDDSIPIPSLKPNCSFSHFYPNSTVLGGFVLPGPPHGTTDCCAACAATEGCTSWTFYGGCTLFAGDIGTPRYQYFEPVSSGFMGPSTSAFGGALSVKLASGGAGWYPPSDGPPPPNPAQLRGTFPNLDCYLSAMGCVASYWESAIKPGLVSRSGAVVIDDTQTPRLINGSDVGVPVPAWYSASSVDAADLYIHAYEADYSGFLSDWTTVSGAIALPARAALGVWYGRYWPVSQTDEEQVFGNNSALNLPLSGAMLDMDWHIVPDTSTTGCASWNQYTWNTSLFPEPLPFVDTVHHGTSPYGAPLKLSMNVHPSAGVDHCDPAYAEFAQRMGIDPATNATITCDIGNATFATALWDLIYSRPELRNTSDWLWADWFGCAAASQAPSNSLLWANALFHQYNALAWPTRRPMILARFGGFGQQRYPIAFSGDSIQHEVTLDFLIQATPLASNALLPWWSHDAGGFDKQPKEQPGGPPPGDADPTNFTSCLLMLRWYQATVTFPIFRQHCDHCERRIWFFPSVYSYLADALRLRAALVPYLCK